MDNPRPAEPSKVVTTRVVRGGFGVRRDRGLGTVTACLMTRLAPPPGAAALAPPPRATALAPPPGAAALATSAPAPSSAQ